jgi:starvation-inducible DNA-binding protein
MSNRIRIDGWRRDAQRMNDESASFENTKPARSRSGLDADAIEAIATVLNKLLADSIALYLKTKSFHWHISGPHFRDYYSLLGEQAGQILESIDPIAERVRKLGAQSLRSVGDVCRLKHIRDNDNDHIPSHDMLAELETDNQTLANHMRSAHMICDWYGDIASASLLEACIDDAEGRIWFLSQACAAERTIRT